ncbi:cell division protein SepF [Candidatus Woesearchaeota archaeon]|nr:cell division protein SepF [Nanoarchaeota archaeon]MCB9370314.1 cell division protein SepF [Candidatus Woesearchaeota archaeon]USN44836.1 MAG: cell division protein SepF [Candidatus Woesearchaeota archaeon]
MASLFGLGKKQQEQYVEDESDDYLSITDENSKLSGGDEKVLEVRVFVLDDYENIREILDVIREEKTMCLIDIHLLRNKDPDELRRSIDKLKKTVEAVGGELVGFHENWVLSAPRKVHIHKGKN